jgi:hypothetical protein
MTRANINIIYNKKRYYTYYNGDQYPSGVVLHFGLFNLLAKYMPNTEHKIYNIINEEQIKNYLKANYNVENPKSSNDLTPLIGNCTDYSYVYNFDENNFKVYNWDDLIFDGNKDEFNKFLDKELEN